MLEVRSIHKTFSRRPAVQDVTFNVKQGEIFGLLGHNGAGKSTSLGIILGMIYPDEGEVFIDGVSVQKHRSQALAKVGSIFESPAFFDYLNGWDNLRILMDFSGGENLEEMEKVIDWVGLKGREKHLVKGYSHGMRQRLALAQALLPMPKILLLDEPTDGLDPEGIKWFRDFILKLRDDFGMTVLLNSHLLSEVEQMCDRVAILNDGKMIFEGNISELEGDDFRYSISVDEPEKLHAFYQRRGVPTEDEFVLVKSHDEVPGLVRDLVAEGVSIRSVVPVKRSLEDLYLSLNS